MFVRIVKMSFHPEHIDRFLANFDQKKEFIRNSPGCRLLELYREKQDGNIFFTYSYWDDAEALENYRHSALFKSVWSKTKPLFSDKPEAWSVDKLASLK